jgi:hypothetical protein
MTDENTNKSTSFRSLLLSSMILMAITLNERKKKSSIFFHRNQSTSFVSFLHVFVSYSIFADHDFNGR